MSATTVFIGGPSERHGEGGRPLMKTPPCAAYEASDAALFDLEEPEPERCAAEVRSRTYYDPPEFCEADAVPGSEFCEAHDPDAYDDYLEAQAEARREDTYL